MLCHTKFDFDYELFLKEYWNLKEYEKDYDIVNNVYNKCETGRRLQVSVP